MPIGMGSLYRANYGRTGQWAVSPDTLPPAIRLGKCYRYDPDEVAAWIAQQKQQRRR